MPNASEALEAVKRSGEEAMGLAGTAPAWMVPDDPLHGVPPVHPWHIDYFRLAMAIIDALEIRTTGTAFCTAKGKDLNPATIKKAIQTEIAKYDIHSARKNIALDVRHTFELIENQLMGAETSVRELETISASALMEEQLPDICFAVESLVPSGLVILAAPPKSGKSWMCLDLAASVAMGKDFFGRHTTQGACLYIAMEDGKRRIKKRLLAMGLADVPPGLEFVVPQTVESLAGGLIAQMQTWIRSHEDARLIIIDTIGRVKGVQARASGNAYETDTMIYSKLQEFATAENVTVLAVTHKRKEGKNIPDDPFESVTGSMGLVGVADAAMMIQGKKFSTEEDGNRLLIDGRDIERAQLSIRFDTATKRW